jgi:ribosome-associated translation inhibitor RaiA
MESIEFNGIEILNIQERKIADKLFNEYYSKIQRQIKSIISLKVYIREHEKEGLRRKLSINLELVYSGKMFKAKAFDWDLARAIHKALNKLMNEIEHKLHVSEQK